MNQFSFLLLFILFPYDAALSNSIFSDQSKLVYVPFLNYQGQNYQATFSLLDAQTLQLKSLRPRNTLPIYGNSIMVDENLNFRIQPINFNGQLYSAQISYLQDDIFSIDQLLSLKHYHKDQGNIINTTPINQITPSQFNYLLNLYNLQNNSKVEISTKNDVHVYSVTYQTLDPSGSLTSASALVAFPDNTENSYPLIAYQHETIVLKENAPSSNAFDRPTVSLAASGYVVVTADYLGFGDSDLLHPFMHAHSLATAVIDALRATRQLAAEKAIQLNGQVFLAGYSEGGYATMAIHREIQRNYSDEFKITASAAMAGPYVLSNSLIASLHNDQPISIPYALPYALLGLNQVYGFSDDLSELLQPPYDQKISELYNGRYSGPLIDQVLPEKKRLYTQEIYQQLDGSDPSWLTAVLIENNIYRWKPEAPLYLFHCLKDNQVSFQNTQIAYDYFQSVGATSVQLLAIDEPQLKQRDIHRNCALPILLQGLAIFDTMVK